MTRQTGFTLIEVIIFIIVTSMLAISMLLVFTNSLQKAPTFLQNMVATQTAKKCLDWYVGQRWLKGYNSISCPSNTVPGFCRVPTGYTLNVNVVCTTINTDANYQTITVRVSGKGNASLTTLVANY